MLRDGSLPRSGPGRVCGYTACRAALECPSIAPIVASVKPRSSATDAKAWRSPCGVRAVIDGSATAFRLASWRSVSDPTPSAAHDTAFGCPCRLVPPIPAGPGTHMGHCCGRGRREGLQWGRSERAHAGPGLGVAKPQARSAQVALGPLEAGYLARAATRQGEQPHRLVGLPGLSSRLAAASARPRAAYWLVSRWILSLLYEGRMIPRAGLSARHPLRPHKLGSRSGGPWCGSRCPSRPLRWRVRAPWSSRRRPSSPITSRRKAPGLPWSGP